MVQDTTDPMDSILSPQQLDEDEEVIEYYAAQDHAAEEANDAIFRQGECDGVYGSGYCRYARRTIKNELGEAGPFRLFL